MTKDRQLAALQRVTDARSEASLAQLRRTLEEERQLRAALDRLRQGAMEFHGQDATHSARYNGVAAAWQNWSDRQIRATNIRLAQVLAEKEGKAVVARRDLGKKIAVSQVKARMKAANGV